MGNEEKYVNFNGEKKEIRKNTSILMGKIEKRENKKKSILMGKNKKKW